MVPAGGRLAFSPADVDSAAAYSGVVARATGRSRLITGSRPGGSGPRRRRRVGASLGRAPYRRNLENARGTTRTGRDVGTLLLGSKSSLPGECRDLGRLRVHRAIAVARPGLRRAAWPRIPRDRVVGGAAALCTPRRRVPRLCRASATVDPISSTGGFGDWFCREPLFVGRDALQRARDVDRDRRGGLAAVDKGLITAVLMPAAGGASATDTMTRPIDRVARLRPF